MNGQGRPFKGRTGQDDPSNRCHQATKDEGSRAATIRPGCTFFWLPFFVQAKKSNSPHRAKPTKKIQNRFAFHKSSVILHYNTTKESPNLVRNKMLNLKPHHRFHIPNTLAIFAAVLLLVTSVVGFENNHEGHSSGQDATPSVKVDTNDSINDSAKHKRRGLKLGLLLFRRG